MTAPQNGTARWQLWVSMAGIGIVIFGSLVTLSVNVVTASSKVDALENRVAQLERSDREKATQIRVLCSNLQEVETQFRGSDQVRNLMRVDSLRIEAMLWKKTFGEEYPINNAYLPTIAQDKVSCW